MRGIRPRDHQKQRHEAKRNKEHQHLGTIHRWMFHGFAAEVNHSKHSEYYRKGKRGDDERHEVFRKSDVATWRVRYQTCEKQEHGNNHNSWKSTHLPPRDLAFDVTGRVADRPTNECEDGNTDWGAHKAHHSPAQSGNHTSAKIHDVSRFVPV